MSSAQHQAADGKIRAPPVLAGLGIVAVVGSVHPLVSPILESGIQAAEIDVGTLIQLVVRAAGKSPAGAVVLVVAEVYAVVVRRQAGDRGRRLDVIDAAPVPIVSAAYQHSKLLPRSETLAHGGSELIHATTADDGGVAAQPVDAGGGTVARG